MDLVSGKVSIAVQRTTDGYRVVVVEPKAGLLRVLRRRENPWATSQEGVLAGVEPKGGGGDDKSNRFGLDFLVASTDGLGKDLGCVGEDVSGFFSALVKGLLDVCRPSRPTGGIGIADRGMKFVSLPHRRGPVSIADVYRGNYERSCRPLARIRWGVRAPPWRCW